MLLTLLLFFALLLGAIATMLLPQAWAARHGYRVTVHLALLIMSLGLVLLGGYILGIAIRATLALTDPQGLTYTYVPYSTVSVTTIFYSTIAVIGLIPLYGFVESRLPKEPFTVATILAQALSATIFAAWFFVFPRSDTGIHLAEGAAIILISLLYIIALHGLQKIIRP